MYNKFWVYLKQVAVESIVALGRVAFDVVPPITSEQFLAEDGAVGTQERILAAVHLAHVEHLSQ